MRPSITTFKKEYDTIQTWYAQHPNTPRFTKPAIDSSVVVERIMRIGVEDGILRASGVLYTHDDLVNVALLTLEMDYIKHYTPVNMVSDDIYNLFDKQQLGAWYMFMTEVEGKLQVLKCLKSELKEVLSRYTSGTVSRNSSIPRLYI